MRPLEGIRILAVEQFVAGPFSTLQLAELGADVVKIEDARTRGDVGRYVPPYQDGEDSLFFEAFNQGKRSLSLALDTPAGQEVFRDLVARSDIVFANVRGDVPDQLGLRYADLSDVNPAIVCCFVTGYGLDGPRRTQPAYDYLLQGLAGWMSITGEPGSPPAKSGLSLVDLSTGYAAAVAMLAALHAAGRTGVGTDCEVSLFDVAISLLGYVGAWQLTGGHVPERMSRSAHPSLVPFENFPTQDGWLVVGCAKEKFWRRLATAVGRSDLLEDPRFITLASRRGRRGELAAQLDEVFVTRPTAAWLGVLEDAGVPCAPVRSVAEALADPMVAERGLIVETDHPRFGRVRRLASAIRVHGSAAKPRRAPQRDEHADEILSGLGYDRARRASLTAAGAFGRDPPVRD